VNPTLPSPPPEDPPGPVSALDRIGGLALAVWASVMLALLGAFWTPLRIGTVLIPISLVIVAAGNWLLVRLAYRATGALGLSLVPALAWLVLTLLLAQKTTEGDLVLAGNNWVANAYIIVGSLAAAFAAYRVMNPGRPRPRKNAVLVGSEPPQPD
jgi:hypothetical protein